MFRYSFPDFDLDLRSLNFVQITRNIKDAYHIIEYTILSLLKYPLSTVLPMNDTSQLEDQRATNSLSNALGGEEVSSTFAKLLSCLFLIILQTSVIAGYQSSHMVHVPQTLYVPRPYEANFKKEANLLFTLPGLIGITLDAALRYNGPKAWETESVDCFKLAKKITIRVLVSSQTPSNL